MPNLVKETADSDLQLNLTGTDKPLISVIIPTYNRLPLLKEAIASVQEQTYTNWELIIVDDGSTDGTAEAILTVCDERIRLISVSHIGHLGILRNIGAAASKGEWLAFLDSDDLWFPKKLERQLQVLFTENRSWGYSGSELIDENAKPIKKRSGKNQFFSGWIIKEILNTQTDFTISSLIIQKTFFEEVGRFTEDPKLFCREDHELTLRLALQAQASVARDIMVRIKEHTERTTNHLEGSFERSAAVYNTFLQYATDKTLRKIATKRKAYHLSEAAVQRFLQKDYKTGIKQLSWSFRNGDQKRHWLSAAKRCVYAFIKKNSSHSAKKRKAENSAAYTT